MPKSNQKMGCTTADKDKLGKDGLTNWIYRMFVVVFMAKF